MRYFDAHCHIDYPAYDSDRSDVLDRMRDAHVGAISVGISNDRLESTVVLAESERDVFATLGFHPHEVAKDEVPDFALLERLVSHEKVVAIGECGLDYFHRPSEDEKRRQRELFERQIDLANRVKKPLMLHIRDAYDDALGILRATPHTSGNAHFFAGTPEHAAAFLNLGFSFSFGGVITFARDYDEVIRSLPLRAILSETDAPFVAPASIRGKRNEPVYVREVVTQLARIRGEDETAVRHAMVENAVRVFSLPKQAFAS
jgi:TatD DNase family protein